MNDRAKKKTAAQMVGVVVFMGAMAWAAVPFYDWFCRVTGFGGITKVAESGSDIVLSETVKIRFDASLERDMPWEFKPVQREIELQIDPEIVEDRDAKHTKVITLSYTFYEKDITQESAKVSVNTSSKFNQLLIEGKPNGA